VAVEKEFQFLQFHKQIKEGLLSVKNIVNGGKIKIIFASKDRVIEKSTILATE